MQVMLNNEFRMVCAVQPLINCNIEVDLMNGLEQYLYSKVKVYIYTNIKDYNNEKAEVILEGVTLEKIDGNFIDLKDENNIIHRINVDKCFSFVVEAYGGSRY
ncbi:hypothetical protein [Clostridium pasteurianum]|nr:hypothetical protein [Clostridium pasteurianum]